MFKNISNQTKILVPAIILSIVLIVIAFIIIQPKFNNLSTLTSLKERITYSNTISSLLTSIQKERGLSYVYLTNYNKEFQKRLLQQRKETDLKIKELIFYKRDSKDISLKNHILENIKYLNNITNYRELVDKKDISKDLILKKYTQLTNYLLKEIKSSINYSNIPNINKNLISFSNFLDIQENLGLMRAIGSSIIINKSYSKNDFIQFISYQSLFLAYENSAILTSRKLFIDKYNNIKKSDEYKKFRTMMRDIIDDRSDKLNSLEWFNITSETITQLQSLISYIKFDTQSMIDIENKNIKNVFLLISNLTIVCLISFIFMIIAFLTLAKSEQKLREVTDKYIISSITDTSGKIIDASQAFCDISGYTKEELLGKSHRIVRHPDMPAEVFRDLWSKISNGYPWSGKVKNLTKDGGFYWVYAHIEPLYNNKGEIDSFISIRLDITESELLHEKVVEEEAKNKLNQELMQQQSRLAQMGEMISMIAHQWRQPLSAITATTGALETRATLNKLDNQMVLNSTKRIKDVAQHLSSTIDDFRNFFKQDKEKVVTDFSKVIDSVYSIIESTLSQKNIELNIIKNSTISLYTYEGELKQVLLNLIKNAEDALIENNIENPKIDVIINENQLIVKDNAGGIPPYIMDKIFDPYFSTKLKKDGTGLGLYMSKTIIEEHCRGKLIVSNDKDGAKFVILLPTE